MTVNKAFTPPEKSVDLLYGVSRKTRENMKRAGLTTLAHVMARSPQELQCIKGIGPITAPAIRANAQAWLENRPVRYKGLPEVCHRAGWMFDLETYEWEGRTVPWCMGWCDSQGRAHIALVAPVQVPEPLVLLDGETITLVPDSDTAWETLADAVACDNGPVYHWTGYDSGMLRSTAPWQVREQLEPRFHDLHATLKHTTSFPLGSTSIKAIAPYLGFPWIGYADWFAAYLDYLRWLNDDDRAALTRACLYQRADVQSLAWVWRWLVSGAQEEALSDFPNSVDR